jgi:hypothetical protein
VLANPAKVKNRKGHKTYAADAWWLAHLLRHSMIHPSSFPRRRHPGVTGVDAAQEVDWAGGARAQSGAKAIGVRQCEASGTLLKMRRGGFLYSSKSFTLKILEN